MKMPNISRARDFAKRALKAGLFRATGQRTKELDVVYAKSFDDALAAFEGRTWNDVVTRSGNHMRQQIAVTLGEKLPLRYEYNWSGAGLDEIRKAVKPLADVVDTFWRSNKLPLKTGKDGWLDPRDYVKGFLSGIAMAYAYEEVVTQSFHRQVLEPALMAGHLPCGWKGRLPAEGIKRSEFGHAITEKIAAKSVKEFFGDGKLIVY